MKPRSCYHKRRQLPNCQNKHLQDPILVTVHRHSLGVSAQLAISGRTDRSAACVSAACCTAFLQGKKLLGSEGLVVDLRGSLDQILEMGSGEEISKVNEFAVILILDVNNTPSVLASSDLFASNDD